MARLIVCRDQAGPEHQPCQWPMPAYPNSTTADASLALHLAADCFASAAQCRLPSEANLGREYAASALDALPPEPAAKVRGILAAAVHHHARAQALDAIANELSPPPKPAREWRPQHKPTPDTAPARHEDFLSCASLAQRLDCSESTVHELVRRGVLPKPVWLSRGCVRWHWPAIVAAIASLQGGAAADERATDDPSCEG